MFVFIGSDWLSARGRCFPCGVASVCLVDGRMLVFDVTRLVRKGLALAACLLILYTPSLCLVFTLLRINNSSSCIFHEGLFRSCAGTFFVSAQSVTEERPFVRAGII